MNSVGFIGLGAMGGPMASNLQRKGRSLVVHDLDSRRVERLVALGARAAASPREVAKEADIVLTMLPDSPEVEAVILGAGGVAGEARRGMLVMDMSTIDPRVTDKMATALVTKGVAFVDAPVGRQSFHAERGECLFMVGAEPDDFARVRPLLEGMGTTIHHCGKPGNGIRTKLVNNYLGIVTCQASAEALALAEYWGLDLTTTLAVVNGTAATNGHLQNTWRTKVLAGDVAPGFRVDLAHKDLQLALAAARTAAVPAAVGIAARERLEKARADGFGDKDFSALLDHVCADVGIAPPRLSPAFSQKEGLARR